MIKISKTGAAISALMMATLAAPVAVAQMPEPPATAQVNSAANLNLPPELQPFAPSDPNIRRATAIVNGTVITATDIDQRLALVLLANNNQLPEEEKQRLRFQVARNLIDETLQIQEARAQDVSIAAEEIDQSYARVAQRFKMSPAQLSDFLRKNGSSPRSMRRQIEGELSWNRVLRRRVEPFVNVSEDEVTGIVDRLNAAKGQPEYRVAEIFLAATPEQMPQVMAEAQKIADGLRQGRSFAAYARQFSQASTASVGGDLGWLRAPQLPAELAAVVQNLAVGQLSNVVPVSGGVSIIYLTDKRAVLTADPRDATLNLRQLTLKFAPGTAPTAIQQRAEGFVNATRAMSGCGAASEVAQKFQAELVDNDQVKMRDLPAPLQNILSGLAVGQATPPFGSREDGIRVLVLCGRDEAAAQGEPSREAIQSQLEETRINQRALRYLRDLRRDAVIEYRT